MGAVSSVSGPGQAAPGPTRGYLGRNHAALATCSSCTAAALGTLAGDSHCLCHNLGAATV